MDKPYLTPEEKERLDSSIAFKKVRQWYDLLSSTDKISFHEYVYKVDRWKLDYASMSDSLRKFYDPKATRPTHQEE